jgi:hypothetical protein
MTHDWGVCRPPIAAKPASKGQAHKARAWVLLAIIAVAAAMVALVCGCGGVSGLNWSEPETELHVPVGLGQAAVFRSKKDDSYKAKGVKIKTKDGAEVQIDEIELNGSASRVKTSEADQKLANAVEIEKQGTAFSQGIAAGADLARSLIGLGRGVGLPGIADSGGVQANRSASLLETARTKIAARVEAAIERKLEEALNSMMPEEPAGPVATQPVEE